MIIGTLFIQKLEFLCNSLAKTIKQEFIDNFIIAGVATGAIGIGILVAKELDLPFIYVKAEAKKHVKKIK